MFEQYAPVLIMFALAAIVVMVLLNAGRLLGPRNRTQVKLETFECGNPPSGPAWGRFSVKFYLTAILFIVFDVEIVFMYPWAVVYRESIKQSGLIFWSMFSFISILMVGYVYAVKKGALDWKR